MTREQEQRWLRALNLEWTLAWDYLDPHVRRRLTRPLFELHDTPGIWGRWHGERRAISISRRLLREYAWPSVAEVLRHELAHQLADQAFGETAPPHGPRFHEACRLVRADPRASSALPSVYQRLEHADGEHADKRDTIRKLLALAASPHPAEAEAAMLKAHALMVKYTITSDPGGAADYVSVCLGEPARRHSSAAYALAGILREFFFVETVYTGMVLPEAGAPARILEVTGTPDNVKMAAYVFEFLRRAAAGHGHTRKVDYALGFYRGARDKLARQREAIVTHQEPVHALVHLGHQRLRAALRERYPRLHSIRTGGRRLDRPTYDAGVKAGREVVLHRPLEHGRGSQGRLLA